MKTPINTINPIEKMTNIYAFFFIPKGSSNFSLTPFMLIFSLIESIPTLA
jgi:hypothetical protein